MLVKRLGLESIEFQSPAFFKELTGVFEALQDLPIKSVPDSEELASIPGIIKNHTGLKVMLSVEDVFGAYVQIPQVNKNHPFIQNYIRNYTSSSTGLRLIQEADGLVRGSVDIMTGRVKGIFEDIPHDITIGKSLLSKGKMLPEECAAVVLHEIGHLMTYYEFIARSVTTNQILAGLSKAWDESGDIKERETVLVAVKKSAKLKDLNVEELAKSNNKKVVEVVVISNIAKETESELKYNVYDTSTWEQLSDQYAARMQAGRYLISALEKIYKGTWNIAFRSLPAYLAFEAFKIVLIIAPALMVALIAMDSQGDGTYDTPGARFKRVRNQIVENLKDKDLSKDDQARLHADLAAIDEMLEDVNDRRQFVGVLWDFLSPTARKGRSYELLQKDLESIAANELFAKASSLAALA